MDNGAIRFTGVRVPRENLLDRFATVDRSGTYASHLSSPGKRFAATLGELTGGRVGLTVASVGVLKVCGMSGDGSCWKGVGIGWALCIFVSLVVAWQTLCHDAG